MSFEFEIDQFKEEYESEEHWDLRKAFLEHWKDKFALDRLLCLARVFANIELLGCRYPQEVMKEVAYLSEEVAKNYRARKKNMLQRTFVSASNAAEDRAKGVKRIAGVVESSMNAKNIKISFVAQGQVVDQEEDVAVSSDEVTLTEQKSNAEVNKTQHIHDYKKELMDKKCLDVRFFREDMFHTNYGPLVMIVRPWICKLSNIHSSCSACGMTFGVEYKNSKFTIRLNQQILAEGTNAVKIVAKTAAVDIAWKRLTDECVSVLVKEQFISEGSARIETNEVGARANESTQPGFGTPVESSVAAKMMKMMGWSGGGLGANADGISEPITPNLQQVHRAGLGSDSVSGQYNLRSAAMRLTRQYMATDSIDTDLIFANDFSKEERAQLHQIAQRCGLMSKSYGKDSERFLVVHKKLDPFNLVRAICEKGGNTEKYHIFLPPNLRNKLNRR